MGTRNVSNQLFTTTSNRREVEMRMPLNVFITTSNKTYTGQLCDHINAALMNKNLAEQNLSSESFTIKTFNHILKMLGNLGGNFLTFQRNVNCINILVY